MTDEERRREEEYQQHIRDIGGYDTPEGRAAWEAQDRGGGGGAPGPPGWQENFQQSRREWENATKRTGEWDRWDERKREEEFARHAQRLGYGSVKDLEDYLGGKPPTPEKGTYDDLMGRIADSRAAREGGFYQAKPGDTLSGIAQRFGFDVEDLLKWNPRPDRNLLRVGEVITIPSYKEAKTPPSRPTQIPQWDIIPQALRPQGQWVEEAIPQPRQFSSEWFAWLRGPKTQRVWKEAPIATGEARLGPSAIGEARVGAPSPVTTPPPPMTTTAGPSFDVGTEVESPEWLQWLGDRLGQAGQGIGDALGQFGAQTTETERGLTDYLQSTGRLPFEGQQPLVTYPAAAVLTALESYWKNLGEPFVTGMAATPGATADILGAALRGEEVPTTAEALDRAREWWRGGGSQFKIPWLPSIESAGRPTELTVDPKIFAEFILDPANILPGQKAAMTAAQRALLGASAVERAAARGGRAVVEGAEALAPGARRLLTEEAGSFAWDFRSAAEREAIAKAAKLEPRVTNLSWVELQPSEKAALEIASPRLTLDEVIKEQIATSERMRAIDEALSQAAERKAFALEPSPIDKPLRGSKEYGLLRGLSDDDLVALARQEGVNPYQTDWFAGIDSVAVKDFKSARRPTGGRAGVVRKERALIERLQSEQEILQGRAAELEARFNELEGGPVMAPRTSVQTGLPGIGPEAAQARMLEEFGRAPGTEGQAPGLVDREALLARERARPLPGQAAMPEAGVAPGVWQGQVGSEVRVGPPLPLPPESWLTFERRGDRIVVLRGGEEVGVVVRRRTGPGYGQFETEVQWRDAQGGQHVEPLGLTMVDPARVLEMNPEYLSERMAFKGFMDAHPELASASGPEAHRAFRQSLGLPPGEARAAPRAAIPEAQVITPRILPRDRVSARPINPERYDFAEQQFIKRVTERNRYAPIEEQTKVVRLSNPDKAAWSTFTEGEHTITKGMLQDWKAEEQAQRILDDLWTKYEPSVAPRAAAPIPEAEVARPTGAPPTGQIVPPVYTPPPGTSGVVVPVQRGKGWIALNTRIDIPVTGSRRATFEETAAIADKENLRLAGPREPLPGQAAIPEAGVAPVAREPWQMTQMEFLNTPEGKPSVQFPVNVKHRRAIEQALREGKPVPPEVLAEYPDLAPRAAEPPIPEAVPSGAEMTLPQPRNYKPEVLASSLRRWGVQDTWDLIPYPSNESSATQLRTPYPDVRAQSIASMEHIGPGITVEPEVAPAVRAFNDLSERTSNWGMETVSSGWPGQRTTKQDWGTSHLSFKRPLPKEFVDRLVQKGLISPEEYSIQVAAGDLSLDVKGLTRREIRARWQAIADEVQAPPTMPPGVVAAPEPGAAPILPEAEVAPLAPRAAIPEAIPSIGPEGVMPVTPPRRAPIPARMAISNSNTNAQSITVVLSDGTEHHINPLGATVSSRDLQLNDLSLVDYDLIVAVKEKGVVTWEKSPAAGQATIPPGAVAGPEPGVAGAKYAVGDTVNPVDSSGNILSETPMKVTDVTEFQGERWYGLEGTTTKFPEAQLQPTAPEAPRVLPGEVAPPTEAIPPLVPEAGVPPVAEAVTPPIVAEAPLPIVPPQARTWKELSGPERRAVREANPSITPKKFNALPDAERLALDDAARQATGGVPPSGELTPQQAFAEAVGVPPKPPTAPLGGPTPPGAVPPKRLVWEMKPVAEERKDLFNPSFWRSMAQAAMSIPDVGGAIEVILRFVKPSVVATDRFSQGFVLRAKNLGFARTAPDIIMANVRAEFPQGSGFVLDKFGNITNITAKRPGLSLNYMDVLSAKKPGQLYDMTAEQLKEVSLLKQIVKEIYDYMIKEGVSIDELAFPIGKEYFPRIPTGINTFEDVQRATLNRVTARPVGGPQTFQKARGFEEARTGVEQGVSYLNDPWKAVEIHLQQAYTAIANKRYLDGITEYATRTGITPKSLYTELKFTKPMADMIERGLTDMGLKPLRGTAAVSDVLRQQTAGMDIGQFLIQGQTTIGHPLVFAKSIRHSLASIADPRFVETFRAKYNAAFEFLVQNNLLPSRSIPWLESGQLPKLYKIPIVGPLYQRAQTGFGAFFDASAVYLTDALMPLAKAAHGERWEAELTTVVRNLLGMGNTIGMGANQALLERTAGFAISYYRASAGLLLGIAKGGMHTQEGIRALASMAAAWVAWQAGTNLAQGKKLEDLNFDPRTGDFNSAEIGGWNIGPGSIWNSLYKAIGRMVAYGVLEPAGIIEPLKTTAGKPIKHDPLESVLGIGRDWARSHGGPLVSAFWDTVARKNYIGDPLQTADDWLRWGAGRLIPFAFQDFVRPGDTDLAGNLKTLPFQLLGLRVWPTSNAEKRNTLRSQYAQAEYGAEWQALNRNRQKALLEKYPDLQQITEQAYAYWKRRADPEDVARSDRMEAYYGGSEPIYRKYEDLLKAVLIGDDTGRRKLYDERQKELDALTKRIGLKDEDFDTGRPLYEQPTVSEGKLNEPFNANERVMFRGWADEYYAITEKSKDKNGVVDWDKARPARDAYEDSKGDAKPRFEQWLDRNLTPRDMVEKVVEDYVENYYANSKELRPVWLLSNPVPSWQAIGAEIERRWGYKFTFEPLDVDHPGKYSRDELNDALANIPVPGLEEYQKRSSEDKINGLREFGERFYATSGIIVGKDNVDEYLTATKWFDDNQVALDAWTNSKPTRDLRDSLYNQRDALRFSRNQVIDNPDATTEEKQRAYEDERASREVLNARLAEARAQIPDRLPWPDVVSKYFSTSPSASDRELAGGQPPPPRETPVSRGESNDAAIYQIFQTMPTTEKGATAQQVKDWWSQNETRLRQLGYRPEPNQEEIGKIWDAYWELKDKGQTKEASAYLNQVKPRLTELGYQFKDEVAGRTPEQNEISQIWDSYYSLKDAGQTKEAYAYLDQVKPRLTALGYVFKNGETSTATTPTVPVTQATPGGYPGDALTTKGTDAWKEEFEQVHGRPPNETDYKDMLWSLQFLREHGRPPARADWERNYNAQVKARTRPYSRTPEFVGGRERSLTNTQWRNVQDTLGRAGVNELIGSRFVPDAMSVDARETLRRFYREHPYGARDFMDWLLMARAAYRREDQLVRA